MAIEVRQPNPQESRFMRVATHPATSATLLAAAAFGVGTAFGMHVTDEGDRVNNVENNVNSHNLNIGALNETLRLYMEDLKQDLSDEIKGSQALTTEKLDEINRRLDALEAEENSAAGQDNWKAGDLDQGTAKAILDAGDGKLDGVISLGEGHLDESIRQTFGQLGATDEDVAKYQEYIASSVVDQSPDDSSVVTLNNEDADEVTLIARAAGSNLDGRDLPGRTSGVKDNSIKLIENLVKKDAAGESGTTSVTTLPVVGVGSESQGQYEDLDFQLVCVDPEGGEHPATADIIKVEKAEAGESVVFRFELKSDISSKKSLIKPDLAYGIGFMDEAGMTKRVVLVQGAEKTEDINRISLELAKRVDLAQGPADPFNGAELLWEGDNSTVEVSGNTLTFSIPRAEIADGVIKPFTTEASGHGNVRTQGFNKDTCGPEAVTPTATATSTVEITSTPTSTETASPTATETVTPVSTNTQEPERTSVVPGKPPKFEPTSLSTSSPVAEVTESVTPTATTTPKIELPFSGTGNKEGTSVPVWAIVAAIAAGSVGIGAIRGGVKFATFMRAIGFRDTDDELDEFGNKIAKREDGQKNEREGEVNE